MRLLSRNTAERRGDESSDVKRAGRLVLGGDADDTAAGDLLQVKRRILPHEALDGDEGAASSEPAAAVAGKVKKIKIRKGGTVEGAKRTVFDEAGKPLEERFEGGFAQLVQ